MMALSVEKLAQAASYGRLLDPVDALSRFTELVTGTPGGLACHGIGLLPVDASSCLYHPDGSAIPLDGCTQLPADRVLSFMHLRKVAITGSRPAPHWLSLMTAALRLGVVARMLDISYTHLNQRTSFGQKTTRHPLIKASFASIYGEITQLQGQLSVRLEQADFEDLEQEHLAITQLSGQAEKLMGGHGYLLGNTHTLSHFSMMVYCVFGKTGSAHSALNQVNEAWQSLR
ncbi:acyl-CoA dehydrogenase family protein [Lonsdalea quercina]|uniref:acyl-CoA dehydrogenase family protein n=1 Tax=Lonsdalea quercina TaxID=71657 RepID=UPI0039760C4B